MNGEATWMKGCPFCGYNIVQVLALRLEENLRERELWEVRCSKCYARGPWGSDEKEAKANWDMRADKLELLSTNPALTPAGKAKSLASVEQQLSETISKHVKSNLAADVEQIRPKKFQLAKLWIEVEPDGTLCK